VSLWRWYHQDFKLRDKWEEKGDIERLYQRKKEKEIIL
jgi:hypothetical protein